MKEIKDPKAMFNPKTVALIGASEKEGSIGRAVLENQKIEEIQRGYHWRIIEPNCLGIIRPKIGFNTEN